MSRCSALRLRCEPFILPPDELLDDELLDEPREDEEEAVRDAEPDLDAEAVEPFRAEEPDLLADEDDLLRDGRVAVAVAAVPREDRADPAVVPDDLVEPLLPAALREEDPVEPLFEAAVRDERDELPLADPLRADLGEDSFADEPREDFAVSLLSDLEEDSPRAEPAFLPRDVPADAVVVFLVFCFVDVAI